MTLTKRKVAITLLAVSSAAGAGLLAPTAQAEPATVQDWEGCNAGNICFWNGRAGNGDICQWSGDDPDWWDGAIKCSWSAEDPPLSVWNRGRDTDFTGVVYFKPDGSRAGCTTRGNRGNINNVPAADRYKVRSHHWTMGACG